MTDAAEYERQIALWNDTAQWHLDRAAYCNARMHELRADAEAERVKEQQEQDPPTYDRASAQDEQNDDRG